MKTARLSRLVLAALLATAPVRAWAQVPGSEPAEGLMRPARQLLSAKAQALRTTAASDTFFVGHSQSNHFNATTNWWNLYTGTNRPGTTNANNCYWDLDDPTGLAVQDSMQGWWPTHFTYRYAPYAGMTDDQYPWFLLDHGNVVNSGPIQGGRVRGVVGVWHSDPGHAGATTGPAALVTWAPLAGTKSAWCGLRALGDLTAIDPITNNPCNEVVAELDREAPSGTPAPSITNYPGYGNQWDQILYRDFTPAMGQGVEISFLFRARLSTSYITAASSRTGWFHGDPLGSVSAPVYPGNFISSSAAGTNAPRDSFSVYVGLPIDDAHCLYSDGMTRAVYDRQRRWFDEVIRVFDAPYFELYGTSGAVPNDTTNTGRLWDQVIPYDPPAYAGGPSLKPLETDPHFGGTLRLVFRVKTNRVYADDDDKSSTGYTYGGFTSYGRGAALVDDVKLNGTLVGDFETPGTDIDNSLAVSALAAWKSTGKPPALYLHPENVALVAWHDLCGAQAHVASSQCNMAGVVMSVGNADQGGCLADPRFDAMSEMIYGMISPTLDLVTNPDNVTPNEMGVTGAMTVATDDFYLWYDINFAAFVLANTGTLWNYGLQCYPAVAANGHLCWSDIVRAPFRYYQSFEGCQPDIEPLKGNSMVHITDPPAGTDPGHVAGIPDSVRIYLGLTTECFYFGGSCNSTVGGYFDNVAFVMANKAGGSALGGITADIWQFFNDAFPVDGLLTDNVAPGTAAFDTTTAMIKGAIDISASTGDALRFDVLADSVVVSAPDGAGADPHMRVDLVFRILPGPGNYQVAAGRQFPPTSTMKLLKVPTNQSQLVAPGDASFWGQYIANPGQFAAGGHHGSLWWDYLTWNSARMDTAETNIFPVVGKAAPGPLGGQYQSTYHESDPHFEALGIPKTRCFVIDTSLSANSLNLTCDSTVAVPWLTAVPRARTGWNGVWATREYTKIIPDGLLTPGSHVQYFFRKQADDGTGDYALLPDSTTIWPQPGESNYDGHRWQQFGVLPDRWKSIGYGGAGDACMLFIDNDDRRGDELVWVSTMDSIGGTASSKWGAHDGWHATGSFDLNKNTNPGVSAAFVSNKNQQPGTAWDMYGVKASESAQTGGTHIGNRYANTAGMGLMDGKQASIGPRKSWLRQYYKVITWMTGDLNTQMVGPFTNVGEDDIGLMEDYLATPGGTSQPRALLMQGDGIAEDADMQGPGSPQLDFLNNYLFAGFRAASYTAITGTGLVPCPDLTVTSDITKHYNDVYAVVNRCSTTNDVLSLGTTESWGVSRYQNVGVNGPYYAAILHKSSTLYPWISLLDGFDESNVLARYCASTTGRLNYYYYLITTSFAAQCSNWGFPGLGCPGWYFCGGVPPEERLADFMKVGNSVVRSGGTAAVVFGVETTGRVVVTLYDVTGRRVRTLADRVFVAGDDHRLTWDGTDDAGAHVARGVYFARITWAANGKSIAGRIVLLR